MKEEIAKLRDCLWLTDLTRQVGISSKTIGQLLAYWPDLADLTQASPVRLAEIVQGPPEKVSRLLARLRDQHWQARLNTQAAEALQKGIKAVYMAEADFPARLKEISGCPPVLYYRGERYSEIMNKDYFVTVIGTRTPSAYGRMVTESITAELASNQVVIVSGLARGIDAVAHRSALKAEGLTIAVVGNGPDLPYPPEHADLMKEIARSGLVISEHPPGTPPRRQHFPARNRILSGLSDAVAVIEASRDSGTMITASFAGDQGRDVFAVPGSILSPFSQGCNQLIRDGAGVLESAQDLMWRLPLGRIQARLEQAIRSSAENLQLDPDQPADDSGAVPATVRMLFQTLAGNPLSLADIALSMQLSVAETAILLTSHELEGNLRCDRGRYSLTGKALFCI